MAKPMLVTLPFVLLLLDYWPLGRFSDNSRYYATPRHGNGGRLISGEKSLPAVLGRFPLSWRLVIEKLPLLLSAMLSCAATAWVQRRP